MRTRPAGRAELLLATGLVWHALVALPALLLGVASQLTSTKLGLTVSGLSVAAFAFAIRGVDVRERLRHLGRVAAGLARLPVDATRVCWRDRTFILPGFLLVCALIPYTAVVAYFAPSWRGWDAIWYHEPIVGFAIQNHGFAPIHSPDRGLMKVDGFPRICEMTNLWFTIFTDRRLIDVANSVIAPWFFTGVYLLIRRFEPNRANALGWSAGLFLVPAVARQLQSTYVDVHAAAFLLAAIHFSIRRSLRLRDVALACLGIALAVAAKHMALAAGGCLTAIVFVRAIWCHARARPLVCALVVSAGALTILAVGACVYLRNYVLFHNPFWPEMRVDIPRLGIHWPGAYQLGFSEDAEAPHLNMQQPVVQQAEDLLSLPFSWHRNNHDQVFGYGFGVGWIVFPLGLFSHAIALVQAIIARFRRSASRAVTSETGFVVLLGAVLAVSLVTSPAIWAPRYNLVSLVLLSAGIAWVSTRHGLSRLSYVLPNLVVFASVLMFYWSPRWLIMPNELAQLIASPYPERELLSGREFAPTLDVRAGSPAVEATALARERELTDGKVIVFGDELGAFASVFWNNRFSNRAQYLPDGPNFIERAEAQGATWIHVAKGSRNYHDLKRSLRWQEVGPLGMERSGIAFRRALARATPQQPTPIPHGDHTD